MAEGKNSRRGNRQSGHQRERRNRDNRRAHIAREPRPVRDSGRERVRRPRRRHRRVPTERGYLSRVLSSLIVVVMVLSALIMFFRVKIVNITGAHRYSDADILSVAGISDGQNMFLMNKYRMAEKLIRELTYLEDVHISRNLPDTLIIDLKECVIPLAVAQDGACWLVSPSGKIVDRLDISAADDYAQITGCPILSPSIGTQIALPSEYLSQQRSLVRLLTALDEKQVLDDVDGIRLEKHNCILVDYAGRFTVKFPLDADYKFKLHALEVYISGEKIQDNMTGTFDLTRDDKNYFQPNVR
ncbi:MAG: FtsQ-type POTRA domain-containing protein [Oscillospiraceae bacterium]|nr:FtsQ-type POTRA domain-containing protein [Oscillospiraceae bacterium]